MICASKKRLPFGQRDGLTTKNSDQAIESTRSQCFENPAVCFLNKNNALKVGKTGALIHAGLEKEDHV